MSSPTPPFVFGGVAGPGSGYGAPGLSSRCCCQRLWRCSHPLVSKPRVRCSCLGCPGGPWLQRFRGSCSSSDRGLTRARPTETIRDRVPGTVGPRRQRRSAGFRSPTQNLRRRVCATIAHCGGARVLVGRFASASASCHGCGRSGCGRRGVPYECAPATRQTQVRSPDCRHHCQSDRLAFWAVT